MSSSQGCVQCAPSFSAMASASLKLKTTLFSVLFFVLRQGLSEWGAWLQHLFSDSIGDYMCFIYRVERTPRRENAIAGVRAMWSPKKSLLWPLRWISLASHPRETGTLDSTGSKCCQMDHRNSSVLHGRIHRLHFPPEGGCWRLWVICGVCDNLAQHHGEILQM